MPTSLEVQESIKDSLIKHAEVTSGERCFANLDLFIADALIKYKEENTTDYSELHVLEQRLIVLLAWVSVCYARASGYAPQPSQRAGSNVGFGFGSDRDTPYKKCMDLAARLMEQYEKEKAEYEEEFGVEDDDAASGDVVVGDLVRRESTIAALVPPHKAVAVPVRSFYVGTGAGAGEAILGWTRFATSEFAEAYVFQSTVAGINVKWNRDGKDGVPYIGTDASKVYTTSDFIAKEIKLTGLLPGAHYFLLVTRSINGLYGYSDEVSVTVT